MVAGCIRRWSSYKVTIAWGMASADSALVVLDKWSSYRGGHISRFDCTENEKLFFYQMIKFIH